MISILSEIVWKWKVTLLTDLSSLAAPEVLTTSCAASDNKFIIVMTFLIPRRWNIMISLIFTVLGLNFLIGHWEI